MAQCKGKHAMLTFHDNHQVNFSGTNLLITKVLMRLIIQILSLYLCNPGILTCTLVPGNTYTMEGARWPISLESLGLTLLTCPCLRAKSIINAEP